MLIFLLRVIFDIVDLQILTCMLRFSKIIDFLLFCALGQSLVINFLLGIPYTEIVGVKLQNSI